jgi:hypothetical protein
MPNAAVNLIQVSKLAELDVLLARMAISVGKKSWLDRQTLAGALNKTGIWNWCRLWCG